MQNPFVEEDRKIVQGSQQHLGDAMDATHAKRFPRRCGAVRKHVKL